MFSSCLKTVQILITNSNRLRQAYGLNQQNNNKQQQPTINNNKQQEIQKVQIMNRYMQQQQSKNKQNGGLKISSEQAFKRNPKP